MAEKGYVDERIVEMQIDNKKFEDGAKKTIKTLEKLEKALNIQSNSNALDNLGNSISKFDASPMADSIEKVSLKMSALEIAGMRVIQNLTDSIYNFTTKTVKGLTVDQLGAGWNKYERLAQATQMIMAATRDQVGEGLTWADEEEQMAAINGYLEQLLWYSDETSYSFSDMVDNLGKFLAAGVPLEDAVTSMMGIASWGASAGASVSEVSRVMYNLSQAMGQGKMQLMDWKSVENANMATLEFKKNVLEIARQKGLLQEVMYMDDETTRGFLQAAEIDPSQLVMGEDGLQYIRNMTEAQVDALITAMNFRESLSSDWFTKDLMTEVYAQYGSFAQMLYEAVDQTGIQATDMLDLLDAYRDVKDSGEDINKGMAEYADDVNMDVEDLIALLSELDSLGLEFSENGFRMGQEAKTWTDAIEATKDAVSSGWLRTFKYIFGDFLEAKKFWTAVTGELYDVFAAGGEVRNAILDAWKNFGGRDALLGIPTVLEDGKTVVQGALWNLIDAIHSFFDPIHEAFAEVFGFATGDQIKETGRKLADFTQRIQEFTAKLVLSEEAQESLKTIFKGIFSVIKGGLKIVGFGLSIIAKVISFFKTLFDVLLALPQIIPDFGKMFTRLGSVLKYSFEHGGIFAVIGTLINEIHRRIISNLSTLFPELVNKLGNLKNVFSIIGSYLAKALMNIIPIVFGIIYYAAVGSVNIIKTVFNTIKTKVLPNLVNNFTKTFSRLWTVIRHGFERGGILGVFSTLKRELSRMFSGSLPKFTKLKKLYDSFIASFKKNYPKLYSNLTKLDLKGRAKNLLTNLDGVRSSVSNFFRTVRSYLSDKATSIANWFGSIDWAGLRAQYPVLDKILTFLSTASDYFRGKWGTFRDWFSGLDFSNLKANLPTFDDVLVFLEGVGTFLTDKYGALKKWFSTINWEEIKSYIPTLEDIFNLLKKIGNFFSTKFNAVKEWFSGLDFSGLSGTKFNLLEFIKKLVDYFKEILPLIQGGALTLLLLSIRNFLNELGDAISSFGRDNDDSLITRVSKALLRVAAAIILIAVALKIIDSISAPSLERSMKALSDIFMELALFTASIRIMGKVPKMGPFISLAISLVIIALVLRGLSKINPEDFKTGWNRLVLVLLSMMAFVAVAGSVRSNSLKYLFSMALGVVALSLVLWRLSKMNSVDFESGWKRMAAIMISIVVFLRLINGVKADGLKYLFKAALSIVAIALVIWGLSKMNITTFEDGWKRMAAIMISMAIFMRSLNQVKFKKSTLIAMISSVLLIVAIAWIIYELSKMNTAAFEDGWRRMAAIMISIVIFMRSIKGVKLNKSVLIGMLEMVVAIGVIAGALYFLAQIKDTKALWNAVGAIVVCLLALAGAMVAISAFGSGMSITSVIGLAAGIIAIIAVAVVLAKLSEYDWHSFLSIAGAIAIVLLSVVGAIAILGSIGPGVVAVGVLSLAILIGGLVLIVWGLMELTGAMIDTGIEFGNKLVVLIEGLQPLLDAVKGIDEDSAAGAERLADILGSIVSAAFWGFIANVITKDTYTFASKITELAEGLKPFLNAVRDLTEDDITKVGYWRTIMRMIAGSSFWELIGAGLSALATLMTPNIGEHLSDLSIGIKPFLEMVQTITEDDITKIGYWRTIMRMVAGSSFWEALGAGFSALANLMVGDITDHLTSLSTGIKPFLEMVQTITEDDITKVGYWRTIMHMVAGASFWEAVSAGLSALSELMGSSSITDNLVTLSSGMQPFFETIKTLSEDDVNKVSYWRSIMRMIVGATFWEKLAGILDVNPGPLLLHLNSIAFGIKPFLAAISGLTEDDATKVDYLNDILKRLTAAEFWNMLSSWFAKWTKEGNDFATIGEKLSSFTDALGPFLDKVAGYGADAFDNAGGLITFLNDVNKNNTLKNFASQVGAFTKKADGVANMTAAVGALQAYLNLSFPAEGGVAPESTFVEALLAVLSSAAKTVIANETFNANMMALGSYVPAGVAKGIYEYAHYVTDAAGFLAKVAYLGFKNSPYMLISSPSKAFANLSQYIPQGVAKGIEENTGTAVDSMTILGSAVLSALELAMAQVATVADDNFEFNPMISPVVDLTNVGSAASYMNSALSGSYGVSATMSDAVSRRLSDVERLAASINEGSSQTINGDNITVNVYPSAGQDPEEIADAVISKINTRGIRRGVAFG